jgi:hypothetical protein
VNNIGAPMGCGGRGQEQPLAGCASDRGRDDGGPGKRRGRPGRKAAELGQLPFLIKRDGTWLYHGTPINRKELVCLFSSVLHREADGTWWLNTPAERGQIDVEDAPFVAVELDWNGDGRHQTLSFRTNVDQVITAGPDHPIRVSHDIITCDPTPYIKVRPGAGHLAIEARISRAVYYELVALAVTEWVGTRRMLGVWSQGKFFALGEAMPENDDDSEDDDWSDEEECQDGPCKKRSRQGVSFEDECRGIESDVARGKA